MTGSDTENLQLPGNDRFNLLPTTPKPLVVEPRARTDVSFQKHVVAVVIK